MRIIVAFGLSLREKGIAMTIEKRLGGASIGPVTATVPRLRPTMRSDSSGYFARPGARATQSGG